MANQNLILTQIDPNGDTIPVTVVVGPNQSGYILQVQSDNSILSVPSASVAAAATTSALGGVIVPAASNLTIDGSGNISAPAFLTNGSGSGITVNYFGRLGRQILKVTMTAAAFTAAAKTKSLTIATLPAKTRVVGIIADATVAFTGGGESAATLAVGTTTGDQLIIAADVLTAAATYGLADADLGASFARADAIQGGWLPSWTGTTAITATLVTTTNNISGLTAGSVTFYLITESM